jgi:hypothetical protein
MNRLVFSIKKPSKKKVSGLEVSMHEEHPKKNFFSFPDYTVDPGIAPDHARIALAGCHRRSGIEVCTSHPAPKKHI